MYERLAVSYLAIPVLLLATACVNQEGSETRYDFNGSALGTTYRVSFVSPSPDNNVREIQEMVEEAIAAVDNAMSTWRPGSELSRFNARRDTDWTVISNELFTVVARAQEIARQTDGYFDITIAPLVNIWGFGAEGTITRAPENDLVQQMRDNVGFSFLELDTERTAIRKTNPALMLDVSAIAKGHAVDRVSEALEGRGIDRYLVEIGGELRAAGSRDGGGPWQVAIEIPRPTGGIQAIVGLEDRAIATSGDYRNFLTLDGKEYPHIIDPHTGWPVTHSLVSVTVLSADTMSADALATAILAMGDERGLTFAEERGLPVMLLSRDGRQVTEAISSNFSQYLEIID